MRALVVLTAAEGKHLVGKAVAQLDHVQTAYASGTIVIHPSSSTAFVMRELLGRVPEGLWVCGAVTPRGTCISAELEEAISRRPPSHKPGDATYSWVIGQGHLVNGVRLSEVLGNMGPSDVYIKGVNVVDPHGSAGVLTAKPGGGTIGTVVRFHLERGFHMILLATADKRIDVNFEVAASQLGPSRLDFSMGIPASLIRVPGTPLTEIEAFRIIGGVDALAVAGGGIAGCEGGRVFVLSGGPENIKNVLRVVEDIKGTQLPHLRQPNCETCRYSLCMRSSYWKGIDSGN